MDGGRSIGGHRAGRYSQISCQCDNFDARPIIWDRMRYLNSKNIKEWVAGARWFRSPVKNVQHRKPIRIKAILALLFFTFNLAGCGAPESINTVGASLANFIHTGRMPIDYIAEYTSGQESNLLKSIENGDPLCQNSPREPLANYRFTLIERPASKVTTFHQPPSKTGTQTIK